MRTASLVPDLDPADGDSSTYHDATVVTGIFSSARAHVMRYHLPLCVSGGFQFKEERPDRWPGS